MAATDVQCVFAFKDLAEGYGWTEVLYLNAIGTLTDARPPCQAYMRQRVQMLAPNVLLEECRVSFVDVLRDSLLVDVPKPTIGKSLNQPYYNAGLAGFSASPVDVAINVRLEASSLYRGPIFLRGNPSDVCTQIAKGQFVEPIWTAAYDNWQTLLANPVGKFCLYVLNKKADPPAPTPITALTAAGTTANVTSVAHGLDNGDFVRISEVKCSLGRFSCSNKPITKTGPDTFVVSGLTGGVTFVYSGKGIVQKLVKFTKLISDARIISVTHRKTGRFFGERRGKARKR